MAHELEIDPETGEANMFSAQGVVPWHGLGTVVQDDAVTAAEALELAGLDWEVEKLPFRPEVEINGETIVLPEVPDTYLNVRSTDHKVLGVVGERYVPLNNVDAFQLGDDILDVAEATWTTAGSLFGGSQVWMQATLPNDVHIAGMEDEAIDLNLVISNSHDGSKAVEVMVTPTRVVCNNTLTLASRDAARSFKARHTTNMSGKIAEAKRALDIAYAYRDAIVEMGESMLAQKVDDAAFDRFLESLVPSKDKPQNAETRALNTQDTIRNIYVKTPNLQNIRGTAWGVMQAVIDYNDHFVKSRGGDDAKKAENRMRRILSQKNITHEAQKILAGMA